jgi:hypothetical protein
MRKNYITPIIEILPFCALNALCESNLSGIISDTGNDAELYGRAPRRTEVF